MSVRIAERRRGFTLVEVLVAVVILGIASAGIAGLMVRGARLARASGQLGYRAAVINAEVARITAIPPGALPDGTTVDSTTTAPFPHTVTIDAVTAGSIQTVTITVTPTGPAAIGGASRVIQRSAAAGNNPFGP